MTHHHSEATAPTHTSDPSGEIGEQQTIHRVPGRRRRRRDASVISGVLTYGLVLVAALLPVPYLVEVPGPVLDTFGTTNGKDVIEVSGAQTYPTQGKLDMLTVGVSGGPGRTVYPSQALNAAINRTQTLIPVESYYPLTTTREQVTSENAAQMTSSQDTATAAALTELKMKYTSAIVVSDVTDGSPADGQLRAGDRITQVNGESITGDSTGLSTIQQQVKKSDTVDVSVTRGGSDETVKLTPTESNGSKLIGVTLAQQYDFPVDVTYNVKGIGGPSAGTIFALTIVDKLTPGSMTGGVPIAGTGEISPDGTVSPIGGARQKVAAAAANGAQYFLSPKDNCAEAVDAAKSQNITVVRIDTLHEARTAVENIGKKQVDSLPTCPAGGQQ